MIPRLVQFGIIVLLITIPSCSNRILSQRLRAIHGKDPLTVVLYGPPLTGGRWIGDTASVINRRFADELKEILGGQVAVINNSDPEATFSTAINHFGELFGSYRPDIVILMLGSRDARMTGITLEAYRQSVEELFAMFEDRGIFVVALTGVGYQSFNVAYDRRIERLQEYNEVMIWKSGYVTVYDIEAKMKMIRETAPEDFRAMFESEFVLGSEGKQYVFDYLLKRFRKAFE